MVKGSQQAPIFLIKSAASFYVAVAKKKRPQKVTFLVDTSLPNKTKKTGPKACPIIYVSDTWLQLLSGKQRYFIVIKYDIDGLHKAFYSRPEVALFYNILHHLPLSCP